MNLIWFSLIVFSISAGVKYTKADNVLLLSWPYFSHLQSLAYVGSELSKYGHTSYFPMTDKMAKMFQSFKGVELLKMKDDPNVDKFFETTLDYFLSGNSTIKDMFKIMNKVCDNFLLDEDWFQYLKKVNASIAVIDFVFMSNCLAIIPYRLSIPFVFQGINPGPPIVSRNPWLPAVFTSIGFQNPNKITFFQRLKGAVVAYYMYFAKPMGMPSRSVKEYAPEKPDISFRSLLHQAELYLTETDFLLSQPLPALPNVKYIGGVAARKAAPLEGDVKKFVDKSNNGIIVVSFGSIVSKVPEEHIKKMEMAFKEIKYDVIWKLSASKYLAPNIFVTKWLPQNDLLGHPKTKLFITHCGNSGQFESLYHGVPMLGFPVFADQSHNGYRMQVKGYGISMDMFNYTKDELVLTINELIVNPKYKNKIKIASEIFHSRPESPAAKGARYIDNVIKYGGNYFSSPFQSMPLYQFLMLDIYAVFLAVIIVSLCLVKFVIQKCYRCCCVKKKKMD
ncbi:UDP-glucuronosyltransferase 2B37 [Octopus bimaculoides]|uniref:UDP-glucuronosyltransferase n=1 Tax=Octopus bimaculoides TaxID=37653 RepID=A0A0L8GWG3_OCTBM|nr:UDP-glucuronosyltransferase 2B37 [Octopus bimaculoides]XP_052827623.1 UDP-glucuronosyltransferase 2B37 [Octopus bimaculoides]|eukprot:XP_014777407.1 PREDICTED: UDP-glucuronosyltransferase 2B37-like [Octopus bimaculoides]